MAHLGLVLFVATALLAAFSGLWLRRSATANPKPGRFDMKAVGSVEPAPSLGSSAPALMRVVVSLLVLAAALFIILSKQYDGDQQKWAFGAIGTVLGYWLKT